MVEERFFMIALSLEKLLSCLYTWAKWFSHMRTVIDRLGSNSGSIPEWWPAFSKLCKHSESRTSCGSQRAFLAVIWLTVYRQTAGLLEKFHKIDHIFWSCAWILLRIVQNEAEICSFRLVILSSLGTFCKKSYGQIKVRWHDIFFWKSCSRACKVTPNESWHRPSHEQPVPAPDSTEQAVHGL